MIKFLKFIPFQLTLFLVLGILTGKYLRINITLLYRFFSIVFVLFTAFYFYSKSSLIVSRLFSSFTFVLIIFIGIFSYQNKNSTEKRTHYTNNDSFNLRNSIPLKLQVLKELKPTKFNDRYEAEVIEINDQFSEGKILVSIEKDSLKKPLQVDDVILALGDLKAIDEPKNPYGFNYKAYLKNRQISHQLYLKAFQYIKLENGKTTLLGTSAKIRGYINKKLIIQGIQGDELAVINALLLGQRNTISSELMQHYVGAGAIHILAVSGLHIGIILLLLSFIFSPLKHIKHGKNLSLLLIIICLWSYAFLAGLSASVVRAVTMFTALTIGIFSNRQSNIYNNLVISIFFLLLINPNYLFEVGFQMSYLAVFFIVWLQPMLEKMWKPKFWMLDKLWKLLTVSFAAQIGVLPLSLYYFHQFPGLFFLSNLIIIPFLGAILILGILTILFALVGLMSVELGYIYVLIIRQLNGVVSWISNQDEFIVKNISFSGFLMIGFYIFVITFFIWQEKKNLIKLTWVLVAVIFIQTVYIFEKYELQTSNSFILFNRSKESLLSFRKGEDLKVLSSRKNYTRNDYPLKDFLIGTGIRNVKIEEKITRFYEFNNSEILVVDSLGLYKFSSINPSIIILRASPKVNLERVLRGMNPKLIVADGSNYKSYLKLWEVTCKNKKTPFCNTMQNGAYVLKTKSVYSTNSPLKF